MWITNGPETINEVNIHECEGNGEARTVDTCQFLKCVSCIKSSTAFQCLAYMKDLNVDVIIKMLRHTATVVALLFSRLS